MAASKTLKLATTVGAIAALGIGFATAQASAQDKVATLAFMGTLTGSPFTADGTEGLEGAQLAIKEINAAGGVAGYKIELLEYDTKEMTPDAVISAFQRIEERDDVSATISSLTSLTNFELEYFSELGVPYLLAVNSQQTRDFVAAQSGRL